MILKKQVYQPDKVANPFIGLLLFLISIILLVFTGPFGLLYGLLYALFTKGFKGAGEFLLKIAISVDQLGNVMMQHLLSTLWLLPGGYPFGNRDETISSALGRNKKLGTLNGFGKAIDAFLDAIDPDHSLNSIDYYVEPTISIVDRLAWVYILDNKVLFWQQGSGNIQLPGELRTPHQSDADLLRQTLSTALGITPELASLLQLGIFEDIADPEIPALLLRQHYYTSGFSGSITPAAGISLVWVGYADREKVSPTDRHLMEYLKSSGMLI